MRSALIALRHAVQALGLADRDQLGLASRVIEHALANQPVVQNDIGGLQSADRLHGEKLGVSRTGADQQHATLRLRSFCRLRDGSADQLFGLGLVALKRGFGGSALEHSLPEFPARRA